jgi:CubicO group peptidase (beta-lactamase class C family)
MPAIDFDESRIDALFAQLDQSHLPGAAVGIALGGRPVYRKGFGLASIELPIVLSPSTRMRIGSTSKHFAALAYLLLCEEGRAAIDDPIGRYLPELHRVPREVTVRQLMAHVGGLRDVHDIRYQFSGTQRPVAAAELLSLYHDIDDVNFAPGTAWSYNNGGYLMLSAAIERIAGQPLEHVLRERIFEPVGMCDSMLRRWDTDFVCNSATLHMSNRLGAFERSYLGKEYLGEGGIVSTVDDMLRWLAHMDRPVIGNAATWQAMKAPYKLVNGRSTEYGMGLMIDRYFDLDTIHHGGWVMGGNAQMLKVPAAGLDIVVIVNRSDVLSTTLADRIIDACIPDLGRTARDSVRSFASGTFRSYATGRVVQLFVRDGQQFASIDGTDVAVEPDAQGVLWPALGGRRAKPAIILEGDARNPVEIRLSEPGNVDHLLAAQPVAHIDVRTIEGRYRSETTGTLARISVTEEGPRLSTAGRFGSAEFTLECLAAGIWRARSTSAMPWGGVLSFEEQGTAFGFHTPRSRALMFRLDT